jgi:uncharacterized protein
MNRLAEATSPYLLQHAGNPVDWYPWGEEAFAEARRRDVPILISIGYAACHWCHVMAHESFEDETTAAQMNEKFVCVKVDREERPDVDAVYMTATTATTGHGGWPMTVFATPHGKPFHCGTYYPPQPRHGMPGFRQLLTAIANAWVEVREDVERASMGLTAELADSVTAARAGAGSAAPAADAKTLSAAVDLLQADFDHVRGGFGGAPKFPPSMTLEHLLRHHASAGDANALAMVEATCAAMARGGMYDQLGGGFARYSVDEAWVVPHFEKMLYDNALLLRVYLHLYRATGDALAARVVEETADFLLRELRTAEGGFASSLDADTEGVEGKFYAWTPAQLADFLGEADATWAARLFAVTERGTFEHGASTLQLLTDADSPERYERVRRALFQARLERTAPGRDDKVVAAWNGLAIAALAEAGALTEREDLVDAARTAADLLLSVHWDAGSRRLVRTSRDGRAGAANPGVLEDYGDVAEGLLALYAVTGETRWFTAAGEVLDVVLAEFRDEDGTFHDTAADAEALIFRPSDAADNATPSGASAAAGALLTYASLTGSGRHREAAEEALRVPLTLAGRAPRFAGWGLAVAEALVDGPREVAVIGDPDDAGTRALHRRALRSTAPGLVLAVSAEIRKDGENAEDIESHPELLRERPMKDGKATAYMCRGFVCEAPTTDADELGRQLSAADAAGAAGT